MPIVKACVRTILTISVMVGIGPGIAHAQQMSGDIVVANKVPMDSLRAFVQNAAQAIPPLLMPSIDRRSMPFSEHTRGVVRANLVSENYLRTLRESSDTIPPLTALSIMMRAWYSGTAEYQSITAWSFFESMSRTLMPIAGQGSFPQAIELFARRCLDFLDDSAFLGVQKRTQNGREIVRQAASLGDSTRYNDELLSELSWKTNKARIWTLLGLSAWHLKKYRDAEQALRMAQQVEQSFAEAALWLGHLAQRTADSSLALKYYAKAALGNRSVTGRQAFETTYRALHGGTLNGAEEFLDSVYASIPSYNHPILPDPYPPTANRPRRRVLVMKATALHCAPCTAKDLSSIALQERYDPGTVVVLSLHFDLPFKPVVDQDVWTKTFKRDIKPDVGYLYATVDGQYPPYGDSLSFRASPGFRRGALRQYDQLREVVDARLQVPRSAYVSATAVRKGQIVDVAVTVDSLPATFRARRVQIVLVEDSIRGPGQEGIRIQRHVMRYVAGDKAAGYGFSLDSNVPGTVTTQLNLSAISDSLRAVHEQDQKENGGFYWDGYKNSKTILPATYTFQMNRLRIVAYVQDDETREVLDVVSVPVRTGH